MHVADRPDHHRLGLLLAAVLFLLAPTVGEFLLGNLPISQYASVVFLAPLYGGGALLIRETARRLGRGWPTIMVFAAAYALVEEALVDQMVFNPGYLGLPSFAGMGEIPGLGISGDLVLYSLALHAVWSIAVPVALIEALDSTPDRPWLGRTGYLTVVYLFVAACVLLAWAQIVEFQFVGTPVQYVVATIAVMALIAAGLLLGRRPRADRCERVARAHPAPRPLVVGVVAFVLTSGYWLCSDPPVTGELAVWAGPVSWLVAVTLGVVLVRHWSMLPGWDGRHRVALAGGAVATYALWFGPAQAIEAGTPAAEAATGALVVGTTILALVGVAFWRQHRLTVLAISGRVSEWTTTREAGQPDRGKEGT